MIYNANFVINQVKSLINSKPDRDPPLQRLGCKMPRGPQMEEEETVLLCLQKKTNKSNMKDMFDVVDVGVSNQMKIIWYEGKAWE